MNTATLTAQPNNWANQAQRNAGLILTREDALRNVLGSGQVIQMEVGARCVDGSLTPEQAAEIIQSRPDASAELEVIRLDCLRMEAQPALPRGYARNWSGEVALQGTRWGAVVNSAVMENPALAQAIWDAAVLVGPHGCNDAELKAHSRAILRSELAKGNIIESKDEGRATSHRHQWDRWVEGK